MEPERFNQLLSSETDRVEWKQSPRDGDGILEAVCALANDLGASGVPGYVLVGVRKDGEVLGLGDMTPDEAQQRIAGRIHDITLQPTPSVAISTTEPKPGAHVLIVEVMPYAVPPVVSFRGVPRVRVGTTTRRASEADLQRLHERQPEHRLPFDQRTVDGASSDDLVMTSLRVRFEAERADDDDPSTYPTFEAWLVQEELGGVLEGVFRPNYSAVLIFGKSPQNTLPGAYVDLARYAGTEVDAPLAFRHVVTGTLPDQLDALWKHLKEGIVSVPRAKDGIVEPFVADYPFPALEELVRNLVQHRAYDVTNAPARIEWFDDRIEMSNPGGPFGHASEGEFGSQSDYRNKTITRILSSLGYVQKLGRGVRRVRSLLAKHGNPPLESETDGFTRVIVRRRSK